MSRSLEDFKPLDDKQVTLYTCGPTVYNYAHIGNFRAYVFADILKRTLSYNGFNVKHVMNITDIDDKTIRDSQKEGKSLKEFTEFYTEAFYEDRDTLNILPAGTYTKATDFIPQMVAMIEKLLENGHAYKGEDGSVYFDIHKDEGYGKLSRFKLTDLKENADGRLKKDEYDKENAQDFALWKAWDESDGDVFWETSLGKGRPGWHIECSAMSTHELGETIDIHTGGVDLIFPHHENEIAQSECASGKPFVNYWLHNEHLLVDNKKMSKSLGNYYSLRDLEKIDVSPLGFRYWLLTADYRTPINFTIPTLQGAENALKRLQEAYNELPDGGVPDATYTAEFKNLVNNDLSTAQGLALMWKLLKDESIGPAAKKATLLDFDKVFGLGLDKPKAELIIPEEVQKLIEDREYARSQKDFALSDTLRAKIESHGFTVKDTDKGQKISKI
jgi:cysteinyl-tRNA synthetase